MAVELDGIVVDALVFYWVDNMAELKAGCLVAM